MKRINKSTYLAAVLFLTGLVFGQNKDLLQSSFSFSGERTKDQQFFIQHTQMINYGPDGTRTGTNELKMFLTAQPVNDNSGNIREYKCSRFLIKYAGSDEWLSVPVLDNWTYSYDSSLPGTDEKGQVFGIDHAMFEGLKDSRDNSIPPTLSYLVYNSFIDFHGFCDVFAEPMSSGNSIKNLTKIGQKIVHAAANSEPPVNLGSNIQEGSYFRNGEVTLALIGLSNVNSSNCAMLEYDSGESSYKMLMKMPPEINIETVGSSHYKGIIYKNLKTNWVEKITMNEFVLSETRLPMPPNKINSATERILTTDNVSKEEFIKAFGI